MGGLRKAPRARDRVIGARLKAIRSERTDLSLEQAAALASGHRQRIPQENGADDLH